MRVVTFQRYRSDLPVAGNGFRPGGAIASEVAAGFFGVPVGPGEKFLTGDGTPIYGNVMIAGAYGNYSWSNGPWAHTRNRYLGLRFTINDQTDDGWARLSINDLHGPSVLTGDAYETTPNTKIIEGELHGAATSNAQPEVWALWRMEQNSLANPAAITERRRAGTADSGYDAGSWASRSDWPTSSSPCRPSPASTLYHPAIFRRRSCRTSAIIFIGVFSFSA